VAAVRLCGGEADDCGGEADDCGGGAGAGAAAGFDIDEDRRRIERLDAADHSAGAAVEGSPIRAAGAAGLAVSGIRRFAWTDEALGRRESGGRGAGARPGGRRGDQGRLTRFPSI